MPFRTQYIFGMPDQDEHIIEAIGKARIIVKNGEVVDVSPALISRCPLARRFSVPVNEIDRASIRANIEERIRKFGMCTKDRQVLQDRDFVLFGASELMSCGIREGLIDCSVIVCDGAGTIIACSPALVQGIGGRMSGLVKTSPIPEVIGKIEKYGGTVIDPATAKIDQFSGVAAAHECGLIHIAVTVACGADARRIRAAYPESLIIGVHLTGATPEEAEILTDNCDIVYACASRHIRDIAGKKALIQGGISVPVFAMTARGRDLVLEKIRTAENQVLIRGAALPAQGENEPQPLI